MTKKRAMGNSHGQIQDAIRANGKMASKRDLAFTLQLI
jgi:hypothetical protein